MLWKILEVDYFLKSVSLSLDVLVGMLVNKVAKLI